MKIERLEIRSFGKFHDKSIELSEGINLFCAENEAGKSTVYAFIKSMFFDIERGRGRAAANDMFHCYEPWDDPAYYGGMIRFESGGRHFQLERDFTKNGRKTRLFCLDDGEELSEEDGDLRVLLSDLDRAGFENTIAVGQLKAEPGEGLYTALRNLAANYYDSGAQDMDLEAALAELDKRQKDVERSIRECAGKRLKRREESMREQAYTERELERSKEELKRTDREIDLVCQEIGENKEEQRKTGKSLRLHPAQPALMAVCAVLALMFLPKPFSYIAVLTVALAGSLFIRSRMKKEETRVLRKRNETERAGEKREEHLKKLCWKQERLRDEIKERQIFLGNLDEQTDETYEISEEEKHLERKRAALTLAKTRLGEVSASVRKEIGGQMNGKVSEILSCLTEGKYTRFYLDEKNAMSVFSENRKIPAQRLSRGTAEQIYFAVRMAAAGLLYEDEYPVILDDTFAFYDEKRMEAALCWLAGHKKQVLLFSCHKREKEALERLHITYRDGWD